MEAENLEATRREEPSPIDWESFYANYRKPGYIPGYEVINKLGGGAFGMVFKARKESIGKDYAIKFLKVDDEGVRDAVMRELDSVRFFAQIDHPNLVSIEDKGEVDGIPYIIMNYAGEDTLQSRLGGGQLPREEALRVFIQAARGVQALHERSLVHFDLKPANIFLKGEIARVGDYGLSKLVTQSRNSLSFGRGTPYYMAPEMLQRRGDARSDIYSLGILLYECLAGDVPFKGDSEWEVLRKHETEAVQFPAVIEAAERSIIRRCLEKDPDDRFQAAAELLREMQAPGALGESMVIGPATERPKVALATPPPLPAEARQARPASVPASAAAPRPKPKQRRAAAARPKRDPKDSPYGMRWRAASRPSVGGFVTVAFRSLFLVIDLMVAIALLPVRLMDGGFDAGLRRVWGLGRELLAALWSLLGYLLIIALLVVAGSVIVGPVG